jgi:hypothetical protein
MTRRGVYFLANDGILDMAIAFLNSFPTYNPSIALCLIPNADDVAQLNVAVIGPDQQCALTDGKLWRDANANEIRLFLTTVFQCVWRSSSSVVHFWRVWSTLCRSSRRIRHPSGGSSVEPC